MEPPLHAALGREVAAAAARVYAHGACHVTPLLRSRALEARSGVAPPGALFLKLESEQATGSFKARGAANRLGALTPDERARGIVTASTGNHAAAVAHALRALPQLRGVPAQIFLPRTVAPAKLARLRAAGAPLVLVDAADCVASEAAAAAHAAATGAVYVSPYADPVVIGGQGTVGLEVLTQLRTAGVAGGCADDAAGDGSGNDGALLATAGADPTAVVPLIIIVPVGGGGLIAGIAAAVKSVAAASCVAAGARRRRGTVVVVGAQPAANACMAASVAAGRILPEGAYPDGPTLSDGTAGGIEAESVTFDACAEAELGDDGLRAAVDAAWAACRSGDVEGDGGAGAARLVDAIALVPEDEIERGMVAVLVAHGKVRGGGDAGGSWD